MVYQVADMTVKGRKDVCEWLRNLADTLQRNPKAFTKTFRTKYFCLAQKVGNGNKKGSK